MPLKSRLPFPNLHGLAPAVITGHVSWGRRNPTTPLPAVFARLVELRPGDRLTTTDRAGANVTFEVYDIRTWPKTALDRYVVFGPTTRPELRLITCGGPFDPITGHHPDNVVVFARAVA